MKILCHNFPCALRYISEGWKNVLERIGFQWLYWPSGISAFDIFDEYEPDIFIGTTYDLTTAIEKCILSRPNLKVLLKANNWGELTNSIDTSKYPIGNADEEEQRKIVNLCHHNEYGLTNQIQLFNFYHENRIKETMGFWQVNEIPVLAMLPAADIYTYYPVDGLDNSLKCDIGFVGGYWEYKARNLNKYMLPLCYPVGKYNVKIFGNQIWPVVQYLGQTNDNTVRNLFNSATICPNISEPHANEFGFEVNERCFKIAACKAFCISDYVASLEDDIFVNNEIPIAHNPEEFLDMVKMFLDNPQLRETHINSSYKTVMKNHTYFNRMEYLLKQIGLNEQSKQVTKLKENYLNARTSIRFI